MSDSQMKPVSVSVGRLFSACGWDRVLPLALTIATVAIAAGCGAGTAAAPDQEPHVVAGDPVAAGRYIVTIAGCNDCHTAGYRMTGGAVSEESWLLGDAMGWRGPWGTTYASNLRLKAQEYEEDTWVAVYMARNDRPPMPWSSLHSMSDADMRAVYKYLRSLGPAGEPAPEWVPPTEEPGTPYLSLEPRFPADIEPPTGS